MLQSELDSVVIVSELISDVIIYQISVDWELAAEEQVVSELEVELDLQCNNIDKSLKSTTFHHWSANSNLFTPL